MLPIVPRGREIKDSEYVLPKNSRPVSCTSIKEVQIHKPKIFSFMMVAVRPCLFGKLLCMEGEHPHT
jgi:hypothetical protein